MKKKVFAFIVTLILSACTLGGCSLSFLKDDTIPTTVYTSPITVAENSSVNDIVDATINAVVTVFIVNKSTEEEKSFGSGVAVASGGYIATNYHVISLITTNPTTYKIIVYHNESQTSHSAELLWHNANLDCAIIKCSCNNLPFVQMEDRTVYPENKLEIEQVIAIGTPLDFSLQNTATVGYISSKLGRVSYSDGITYENLIQHTAPINHGNSGGPLFDMKGKLIGLNTLGHDNANSLFFAVPIYPIKTIIDRVVEADKNSSKYTTPILGFSAIDKHQANYSGEDFASDGMLITTVSANGPSSGKLQINDRLVGIKVNGINYEIKIRNDMIFAILKANKGEKVTLEFVRGIVKYTEEITLG